MFGNNGYKPGQEGKFNPRRKDEFDPWFAIGLALATIACVLLAALVLLLLR